MHQRNQQRTKNNRVVQKCTKTLLYQNMRYNSGKAPESRRFRGFLLAEIISDSRFWASDKVILLLCAILTILGGVCFPWTKRFRVFPSKSLLRTQRNQGQHKIPREGATVRVENRSRIRRNCPCRLSITAVYSFSCKKL